MADLGSHHICDTKEPSQLNKLILLQANQERTLLMVAYTTVFQYLFFLREISILLTPLGTMAMVYLAAAVSDFYIHPSHMVGYNQDPGRYGEEC